METSNAEKRKSIIAKIQALLNKTIDNGCTEAEALSASELVGKLMNDYNVTLDDVSIKEETIIQDKIETWSNKKTVMFMIVITIAKYTNTKYWYNTDRYKNIIYTFFGYEYDVMVAKYIYAIIKSSHHFELERFKKSEPYLKNFNNSQTKIASWNAGFEDRIIQRLRDLKSKFSFENQQNGLILYDKTKEIELKFKSLGMIITSSTHTKGNVKDLNSFSEGQKSANNVQLNNGLNQKHSTLKIN